jgi:CBS domain-containing protein
MIVTQILNLKGSAAVETISPDACVADAAAVLAEKRYGALLVSATGSDIDGIISERDIVRALARQGGGCLTVSVGKLMTREVETCAPSDNAISVLERMTAGRFRHMPVVEDGKMVGLLSIGDVVKARISEIEQENAAMAGMLSG